MRMTFGQAVTKVSTAASLSIILTACGVESDSIHSNLDVTNGIEISEETYASVVLLVSVTEEGQSICTATFVNDQQVVTAGHCVYDLDPNEPSLYYVHLNEQGEGEYSVKAKSFAINPDYDMTVNNGVNPQDLAVVTFPEDTAPAVSQISFKTPAVGSELTIVGYGNNRNYMEENGKLSGSGAGTKRVGDNILRANSSGFLSFYGLPEANGVVEAGEQSASASGDSGGPMIVGNRLVGVTSGGGLSQGSGDSLIKVSHYVDLNSPESRRFLSSALVK